MRADSALSLALAVVLAATLPAAAAGAAGTTPGAPQATVETPTGADGQTVTLDVQLLGSGDAEWTVSTYVRLEDAEDRAAFRELGRQYVNGTTRAGPDVGTFRRAAASASAASDRQMSVEDVRRDWAVRDGSGVLVLSFTWQSFARPVENRLVVDDAFRTPTGTWLPRLAAGQTLVMRPPEDQGFLDTPQGKGVDNGTLRWEGPETFGPDYFEVVYRAGDDTPSATGTDTTPRSRTPSDTLTESPTEDDLGGVYAVLPLVAVAAVVAYLWQRRRGPAEGAVAERDDRGSEAPAASTEEAGAAAADEAASDESTEPTEASPEAPFAGIDVEMLSDEERVLRLLRANGGRMKQARIVKETDWSNAKVSQLLSAMDDEGAINKLRIGRENLISLPDVDIEGADE